MRPFFARWPSVSSGVLDNPAVLSLSEPVPARSTVVAMNNQTVRRTGLLDPAAAALHDGRAWALLEVVSRAPKRQNIATVRPVLHIV